MRKESVIILRVDSETKKRLVAAAESRGMNLTSFLIHAAKHVARGPVKHMGLKGMLAEAARGGANGYRRLGEKIRSQPVDVRLTHMRLLENLLPKRRRKQFVAGYLGVVTNA